MPCGLAAPPQIWMHSDSVTPAPGDTRSGAAELLTVRENTSALHKVCSETENAGIWKEPRRPTLEGWLRELWQSSHNRNTQSNEKWRHGDHTQ